MKVTFVLALAFLAEGAQKPLERASFQQKASVSAAASDGTTQYEIGPEASFVAQEALTKNTRSLVRHASRTQGRAVAIVGTHNIAVHQPNDGSSTASHPETCEDCEAGFAGCLYLNTCRSVADYGANPEDCSQNHGTWCQAASCVETCGTSFTGCLWNHQCNREAEHDANPTACFHHGGTWCEAASCVQTCGSSFTGCLWNHRCNTDEGEYDANRDACSQNHGEWCQAGTAHHRRHTIGPR